MGTPPETLPEPGLLIGDRRGTDSSGGQIGHLHAATGTVTGQVTLGGAGKIDAAVAARKAFPGWRKTPLAARRAALQKLAELAALGTIDDGTLTTLTVGAAPLTADLPYGVVGLITPWNGPLISCGMILGPALGAISRSPSR